MNHEVYSSKRWMNDIGALCKRLAATWRGDGFAVLEYTRGRYPEPLASQLARRLSLSFQFVTANRRELEDEGIMGPGSSTIPEAIMAALYHWLVMVPRTLQTGHHEVLDPPLDVILMNVKRILDRERKQPEPAHIARLSFLHRRDAEDSADGPINKEALRQATGQPLLTTKTQMICVSEIK